MCDPGKGLCLPLQSQCCAGSRHFWRCHIIANPRLKEAQKVFVFFSTNFSMFPLVTTLVSKKLSDLFIFTLFPGPYRS